MYKKKQGLRKKERIKSALTFKRVFKEGVSCFNRDYSIRFMPNSLDFCRLGISAQKRLFPKAPDRNLIKRRLREIFRKNKHSISINYDIIIIPKRAGLNKLLYKQIEDAILDLFKKAGLTNN